MDLDFVDTGTGPALLFVPGSYSNHAAWKGVQRALAGSYRVISISLPGYGGTPEVRDLAIRDMAPMADFLAEVVRRVGEPVHLVGHSWGGLVSFAATLSGSVAPLSMITFEANPIYSRRPEGQAPWFEDLLETIRRFEAAQAAGDPDAAGIIIDYWGQPGFFQAMPDPVRDYCRAKTATNVLDWRSAAGFTPLFAEYGAIGVPCTVVRGAHANAAIVDISAEIARALPSGDLRVVDGAGHFLISTHPDACAAIIDAHMARLSGS